jgi:hypothetical protein
VSPSLSVMTQTSIFGIMPALLWLSCSSTVHFTRLSEASEPKFASVAIAQGQSPAATVIEVEFASGARLRIGGPIEAAAVVAAITALARGVRQR